MLLLCAMSHLIFSTIQGSNCYCPHFIDEENEGLEGLIMVGLDRWLWTDDYSVNRHTHTHTHPSVSKVYFLHPIFVGPGLWDLIWKKGCSGQDMNRKLKCGVAWFWLTLSCFCHHYKKNMSWVSDAGPRRVRNRWSNPRFKSQPKTSPGQPILEQPTPSTPMQAYY